MYVQLRPLYLPRVSDNFMNVSTAMTYNSDIHVYNVRGGIAETKIIVSLLGHIKRS